MSLYLALAAILLSTGAIVALCANDPKRRRAVGRDGGGASRHRWSLLLAAVAPGLVCALLGDSAAFMLWLGGLGLAGWLTTVKFGPRTE